LAELGEASSADLAAFIEQHYRVRIEPKYIPVFRASVRDKVQLQQARARARDPGASQQADSQCQAA
jgi:hypothetical protein